MSLDLSQDYLIIDDPKTISLYRKTGEGVYGDVVEVTYAQPAKITERDMMKNPLLGDNIVSAYNVWKDLLGGYIPSNGDRLVDGVGNWTVKVVEACDNDAGGVQRYRLLLVQEIS